MLDGRGQHITARQVWRYEHKHRGNQSPGSRSQQIILCYSCNKDRTRSLVQALRRSLRWWRSSGWWGWGRTRPPSRRWANVAASTVCRGNADGSERRRCRGSWPAPSPGTPAASTAETGGSKVKLLKGTQVHLRWMDRYVINPVEGNYLMYIKCKRYTHTQWNKQLSWLHCICNTERVKHIWICCVHPNGYNDLSHRLGHIHRMQYRRIHNDVLYGELASGST